MYAYVCTRALISGPASVARTAIGDAKRVARSATRLRRVLEAFFAIYQVCTKICAKTKQQSAFYTPPEPRKGVYHALGCLGEESS